MCNMKYHAVNEDHGFAIISGNITDLHLKCHYYNHETIVEVDDVSKDEEIEGEKIKDEDRKKVDPYDISSESSSE